MDAIYSHGTISMVYTGPALFRVQPAFVPTNYISLFISCFFI